MQIVERAPFPLRDGPGDARGGQLSSSAHGRGRGHGRRRGRAGRAGQGARAHSSFVALSVSGENTSIARTKRSKSTRRTNTAWWLWCPGARSSPPGLGDDPALARSRDPGFGWYGVVSRPSRQSSTRSARGFIDSSGSSRNSSRVMNPTAAASITPNRRQSRLICCGVKCVSCSRGTGQVQPDSRSGARLAWPNARARRPKLDPDARQAAAPAFREREAAGGVGEHLAEIVHILLGENLRGGPAAHHRIAHRPGLSSRGVRKGNPSHTRENPWTDSLWFGHLICPGSAGGSAAASEQERARTAGLLSYTGRLGS